MAGGGGRGCVATETSTAADGTHPTGMHSCSIKCKLNVVKYPKTMDKKYLTFLRFLSLFCHLKISNPPFCTNLQCDSVAGHAY